MTNQFIEAAEKRKMRKEVVVVKESSTPNKKETTSFIAPSRIGTKHIGGYFSPEVAKQLKLIAVEEDKAIQALLAEALDLFFQSRNKPTNEKKKTTS